MTNYIPGKASKFKTSFKTAGLNLFAFKSSGIPFDYFFTISPHMLKVLFGLADYSNCERSELSFPINSSTY